VIPKRLAALVFLCGCLDPADPQFPPPPSPPFYVIDSRPPIGATGVPTDVIIDVGFSDVPYPPDVPAAWQLNVAGLRVTGLAFPDLVDKRLRVRAARGLMMHTQYTLTIKTSLHSFAGRALQNKAEITFVTGNSPAGGNPSGTPKTLSGDVLPALASCSMCHSADDPMGALDLSTAAGVLAAIGKQPALIGSPPLITPGSHPQSYLVWKALGLPHTSGHSARDGIMLSHDQARVLADWIDQGASAQ
jgi:Big-like domain-containing protein